MNIQNQRRSCNVPEAQKPGITDPIWFEAFMSEGGGVMPFPGWAAILLVAVRDPIVIRRDGAFLRAYEVGYIHALEFWGEA